MYYNCFASIIIQGSLSKKIASKISQSLISIAVDSLSEAFPRFTEHHGTYAVDESVFIRRKVNCIPGGKLDKKYLYCYFASCYNLSIYFRL